MVDTLASSLMEPEPVADVIRNGQTGVLVPPDDPQALADAMVRLAVETGERVRLGQQAQAFVRGERTLTAAGAIVAEALAGIGVR